MIPARIFTITRAKVRANNLVKAERAKLLTAILSYLAKNTPFGTQWQKIEPPAMGMSALC